MKRLLLATTLLFLFLTSSHAQLALGFKMGINSSRLVTSKTGYNSEDSRYGWVMGGFIRAKFGNLSFQPELLYSQKGGDYSSSTLGTGFNSMFKNKIDAFDLPVMCGLHFAKIFHLNTGPVFSFVVKEKSDYDITGSGTTTRFINDQFNLSWQLGGGIEISEFIFDLRYEFGITKMVDDFDVGPININPKARNDLWQVTIAYKFLGE